MERPMMKMLNLVPQMLMDSGIAYRLFTSKRMYQFVRHVAERNVHKDDISLIASYSSLAKYVASDVAVVVP